MQTNKDLPSTWVKYKESNCQKCIAACCMMPVEVGAQDLIRLKLMDAGEASLKKVGNRLVKEGYVKSFRHTTGLFMLAQQSDGACVFLTPDTRRCKVYEDRPDTCRNFPERVGIRLGCCPYKEKQI